jgi:hypothetical protein
LQSEIIPRMACKEKLATQPPQVLVIPCDRDPSCFAKSLPL